MPSDSPFIVAEMGASHHRSMVRAARIIAEAKYAGADAIKLQTFTPDTMVSDKSYVIPSGPWAGRNLYDLYAEAACPLEWHEDLFSFAKEQGIECFSTPFDETAVEFLENLGCNRYKIASFEITDIPLIRCVAETKKPMIVSTGMATIGEIEAAVNEIRSYHDNVTLLKCTSAYPAEFADANLRTMSDMRLLFACNVGVSDHTMGSVVPAVATVLGATVIEKHITLDDEPGPDSKFAMRPYEFKRMVRDVRDVSASLGNVQYGKTKAENDSALFRRSIYATRDIQFGERFNKSNVALRRPSLGLDPQSLDIVLGGEATHEIKAGSPIQRSDIG